MGTDAIVAWPEKLPPREAEPKDVLGDPQKAEQAMRQRHPESKEPTAEQRAAGDKPREQSLRGSRQQGARHQANGQNHPCKIVHRLEIVHHSVTRSMQWLTAITTVAG